MISEVSSLPNIKSAKKRVRVIETKTLKNQMIKTNLKTTIKKFEAAVAEGNERAKMTLDVYNYRIKKYIGAYAAAMNGCDILVWTGGVGENQWTTRRAVCEDMEYMGMKIDVEKNEGMRGEEMVISTPDSKVTIIVVPTDEEYMIASDTMDILGNK